MKDHRHNEDASSFPLSGLNHSELAQRLKVKVFCGTRCMAALLGANRVHAGWWREKADVTSALLAPTNSECLLRGHELVLLEGRGDNVKGVNSALMCA
jgi:hypothetical protein